MIAEVLISIAAKKERLDELRPLSARALAQLDHYYDIELTYTSNAIEGNTLSAVETTLVIEKGITVNGKPLKDHFEALDHFEAIRYVRELARLTTPLTESDVRNLHNWSPSGPRLRLPGSMPTSRVSFARKQTVTRFRRPPRSRR